MANKRSEVHSNVALIVIRAILNTALLSVIDRHARVLTLRCTVLNLNAPIAAKVVCFSRLLKCLKSLYGKQCGPRTDCSYRSSLFWVHTVCFYTLFPSNARQLFAADGFSRQHFQMHVFLGALRVKVTRQDNDPMKKR